MAFDHPIYIYICRMIKSHNFYFMNELNILSIKVVLVIYIINVENELL